MRVQKMLSLLAVVGAAFAVGVVVGQDPTSIALANGQNGGQDGGQDAGQDADGGWASMTPEQQMAMWAQMNAPGEHHKAMARFIGTWDAVVSGEMSGQPFQATGVMTNTWVMGEKFVRGDYQGEMLGMRYQGLSFMGYSNADSAYQSLWIDEFGSAMSITAGSGADGSWDMRGSETDPMSGQALEVIEELVFQSDRQYTLQRDYMVQGQRVPAFTIVFTKRD